MWKHGVEEIKKDSLALDHRETRRTSTVFPSTLHGANELKADCSLSCNNSTQLADSAFNQLDEWEKAFHLVDLALHHEAQQLLGQTERFHQARMDSRGSHTARAVTAIMSPLLTPFDPIEPLARTPKNRAGGLDQQTNIVIHFFNTSHPPCLIVALSSYQFGT